MPKEHFIVQGIFDAGSYNYNILTLLIIKIKYINFNYKQSGGIIDVYENCALFCMLLIKFLLLLGNKSFIVSQRYGGIV